MLREEPAVPRSPGRDRLLLVLSGNMLLDALEVSAMLVAAPAIAAGLGLPTVQSAHWLVTAFALGFGATLPLGNTLAGRFGRRRVYLAAVACFALASLVAAAAGSLLVLALVRALKGACVALTAPAGLSIIASTWPQGPARQRALRVYSIVGGSGFALGMLVSGALLSLDWRATLLFPAPFAVLLLVLAARTVPDAPVPERGTPKHGRERPGDLQPVRSALVRSALVRSALVAAALNGTYWAALFLLTVELQQRQGHSPLYTAVILLPASLPLALSWWLLRPLEGRLAPARLIAVGSVLTCLGYLLLVPETDGHPGFVLPALLLVGSGFVLGFSALHGQATAGLSGAALAQAGTAYQTAVQLGGALTLLTAVGLGSGMTVVCVVAAAGAVIALSGLRPMSPRSPRLPTSSRVEAPRTWNPVLVQADEGLEPHIVRSVN